MHGENQSNSCLNVKSLLADLQGNEARVYELVVRHFLACVSKDAVGSETIVNIDIAGEKFSANGLVIHERNYLDVYVYDKWSAKQIHNYEQGQRFEPTEIVLHEGATTAPPLLTEADLIALMEKHGIGTDATHAEHINTIKERGYIGVVDKGALVPGVIGMGLYEGYDAMELALAKPLLRAEFEADLKRICLGEKDPKLVLREQIAKYKQAYQQIMEKITAMDAKIAQRINETPAAAATSDASQEQSINMPRELCQCPKCELAPLVLKPKKNQTSFFIGCFNFPDCKNVIWLPEECKEYSVLDECCPSCGEGYHMLKFRLSSAYYRGLFNAPHGWYKNCLRCDELFRSTFNINLDQVKRVGGIVGHAPGSGGRPGGGGGGGGGSDRGPGGGGGGSGPRGPPGGGGSGPRGPPGGSDGSSWGTASNSGTQKPAKPKRNNKTSNETTTGPRKATKTKRTTAPATTGGIRNYTTSTNQHTASLDGFFDSNDGFDEQLLAAAAMAESGAAPTPQLDADIAAVFAADDDADFEALLEAGDSNNQPTAPTTDNLDTSLTQWMRKAYEAEEQPMLWGRQARAAAEAQPTAKRPRLIENIVPSDSAAPVVLCSGCHLPGRQQTVRKDGPNHGRLYYKCPKPNECKFFQWADEQAPTAGAMAESDWGTRGAAGARMNSGWGAGSSTTSWGTEAAGQQNKGKSRETDHLSWGTGGSGQLGAGTSQQTSSWGTKAAAQQGTDGTLEANTWGSGSTSSSWGTRRASQQGTGDSQHTSSWGTKAAVQQGTGNSQENNSWGKKETTQRSARNSQESHSNYASSWVTKPAAQQGTGSSQASNARNSNHNNNSSSWGTSAVTGAVQPAWGSSNNMSAASSRSNQRGGGTIVRSNGSSTVTVTKPMQPGAVNCNCGKPAKSLTVRKDGPNQGRPFYACETREKSCGFFQWGDTIEQQGEHWIQLMTTTI